MDGDYAIERPRIAKLTGTNYHPWSIQVKRMLQAKGLWQTIEPSRKTKAEAAGLAEESEAAEGGSAAAEVTDTSIEDSASETRDAKASSIIMGVCAQGPLSHILLMETAQEQWAKLKALYAPLGMQQLGAKIQAFNSYAPRTNDASIADIATELDTLQAEIGAICPEERPSNRAKTAILTRVVKVKGARYDTIALQLDIANVIQYDDVVTRLTEFERKIADSKPISETALQAGASQGGKRAFNRGRNGQQKKPFTGNCYYCEKPGHRKAECHSRKRDEEGKASEKGGQPSTGPLAAPGGGKGFSPLMQGAQLATETSWIATVTSDGAIEANLAREPVQHSQGLAWVIDSGCTRHMTYAREAFTDYLPLDKPIQVNIANGACIDAVAKGTVSFQTLVNGSKRRVQLNNVLHVPHLAGSLISVIHLQDRGIMTRTISGGQMLLELEGRVVGIANRIGRTYVLSGTEDVAAAAAYRAKTMTPKEIASLWHRRFGHLSSQSLRLAHTVTDGMPGAIEDITEPCESCRLNKSTKVINRQGPERATRPLERIHSDVWGPYRVPAIGGGIYFITFTDDYTRKSWVYIATSKDQIRTIFSEFRVRAELETGQKVIILRCDNGGEYKGLEHIFGTIYGIKFEYTTAYTPWQNGVSERLNRSLVSVARAMLADAQLPPELWGEAVMAASYIRNRTPIGPNGLTPEEAYSGKRPSVAHLRAWGCVAYAHVAPEQRDGDKLAPNAIRTALVGYMPTSKQYRLYDPKNKRILVSTSPRFEEGHRLQLPGGPSPHEETVGFDPMEADPLDGSAPDLNAHIGSSNPFPSLRRMGTADTLPISPPETISRAPSPTTIVVDRGRRSNAAMRDSKSSATASHAQGTSPQGATTTGGHRPTQVNSHDVDPSQGEDNASDEEDVGPGQQLLQEEAAQGELPLIEEPVLRRSGRGRRPARHFEEAYVAAVDAIPIPGSFAEALSDPVHGADWAQAVGEELRQLQALGTWELSDLPKGKKPVGCRWVFNVKYTPTGLIDRFKARLVAQGFSQVLGNDYLETFSPTIRAESLRLLLAIGAQEDLEIRQIDVVSAYPRADLHAEVYMRPPEGLDCPKERVLRIRKSLYGLKQSGREWYIEACKGLEGLGLEPLFGDPSIFGTLDRKLLVGLYVDDMLILSKDPAIIDKAVAHIRSRWEIKELGEVSHILGLRVLRDRGQRLLSLDQTAYIDQMIERFGLLGAKPCPTPAVDRAALVKGTGDERQADQRLYQEGIGCLNWVTIGTRFDAVYVLGQLSQHCSAPTIRNWNGVLHLMRYLMGTRELRLTFGGKGDTISSLLQGFCDADYACDQIDRRSVTGHLFLLNKGLVSWTSAKQRCVATSTAEAEYIALAEGSKQGQWLRTLLKELCRPELIGENQTVQLSSDNQACITIAEDPIAHRRTKHIDVRYHYIRQLISFGKARVSYVPTEDMIADVLTKPLPPPAFKRCIRNFLTLPAK